MAPQAAPDGFDTVIAVVSPRLEVQVPAVNESSFNKAFMLSSPDTMTMKSENLTKMSVAVVKYPSVQAVLQDTRELFRLKDVHNILESNAYKHIIDAADPNEVHVDLSGPFINVICKAVTVIINHIQTSHDARANPRHNGTTPAWHSYYVKSRSTFNRASQRGAILRYLRYLKREMTRHNGTKGATPTHLSTAVKAELDAQLATFSQRHPEYNRGCLQSTPNNVTSDNTTDLGQVKVEEEPSDVGDSGRKMDSVCHHNSHKIMADRRSDIPPKGNESKSNTVIIIEDSDDDDDEPLHHKWLKTKASNQAVSSTTSQTPSRKKIKTEAVEQESVLVTTAQPSCSNDLVKLEVGDHRITPMPTTETQADPSANTNKMEMSAREKEKARIKMELQSVELLQESVELQEKKLGLKQKNVGLKQQLLELEDEYE